MDEALRCIIQHNFGEDSFSNAILENLKTCENKKLLNVDSEFYKPVFVLPFLYDGNFGRELFRLKKRKSRRSSWYLNQLCDSPFYVH